MTIVGMEEEQRKEGEDESRERMERLSLELKDLILALPPRELLGYISSTMSLTAMFAEEEPSADQSERINLTQFILEYIHAVLACFPGQDNATFDEAVCAKIFAVAEDLRRATGQYCLFSSIGLKDGVFGEKTGEILHAVQSNWTSLRGNRYGRLEGEFLRFVLEPHDDLLREIYGIGAVDIAIGIQSIVDSMAGGHADAVDRMENLMNAAKEDAQGGLSQAEALERWKNEHPEHLATATDIFFDLFRGGSNNLSKHTKLPSLLLEDLAYERGGNTDFFASGPLAGTPMRTLPARIRPLVKLDGEYFSIDKAFVRDATYRALLWNLLQRQPAYRELFEARQKDISESAFSRIFQCQLAGASVHREVWYKDPQTRQWVENDTVVCIDDVLLAVEAKSGAAATIASPAVDFERHARSIRDLILKAYQQCRRFIEYVNSADEASLYRREDGRYVETGVLRARDYRLMIPIGLTMESFSPYSCLCKQFDGIDPIFGRHAFLSMSIDDLLVLDRFLPTSGELFHYLQTRQSVAGIKDALLFDEMDHLGSYISKNRFDITLKEQFGEDTSLIWWDGMSGKIDRYFAEEDITAVKPPGQRYPDELQGLLDGLNSTKAGGWLAAESHIRTLDDEGRDNLAAMLAQVRRSLAEHPSRYFQLGDNPPIFIWLQRLGSIPDLTVLRRKAMAAAVSANANNTIVVLAYVNPMGKYVRVAPVAVEVPLEGSLEHSALKDEVERMSARQGEVKRFIRRERNPIRRYWVGRNDPCPCGSGKKYKKCHMLLEMKQ